MVPRTTDGEGTRRTRSAPATESLGGGRSPVVRRRDSETCPFGEAIGVAATFTVRGKREEEGVVRRGDAGHVPVRGTNQHLSSFIT